MTIIQLKHFHVRRGTQQKRYDEKLSFSNSLVRLKIRNTVLFTIISIQWLSTSKHQGKIILIFPQLS